MPDFTFKRTREEQKWCPYTLIPEYRIKSLQNRLLQCEDVQGEVWECGVYRGGSAFVLQQSTAKLVRLFDSWEGLPAPSQQDGERFFEGEFSDVDFECIQSFFGNKPNVRIHRGFIPGSFAGLEESVISFAHIDLDLYQSYIDALEFIYPRLAIGGVIVFDDYGHPQCEGATRAVDEFFAGTSETVAPPTTLESAYMVRTERKQT